MIALVSSGKALVAVSITFPVIAAFAIFGRFRARQVKKTHPQADDYAVVVSWILALSMGISYIAGVYLGGVGHTFEELNLQEVTINTKAIFAGQFFYLFSVGFVKISIVLFYKRVFTIKAFKFAANIMLLIISLWLTAFFLTTLFQSWPISQNWTGVGRNLMSYTDMYLALGATDLAIDVSILCMPMPVINNLKLKTRKKISVGTILGLGFLTIIASAVRINYVNQIEEGTIASFSTAVARYMIWSQVEACWSIICACLPTFGPLLRSGRTPESIVHSFRSVFSERSEGSLRSADAKTSSEHNDLQP